MPLPGSGLLLSFILRVAIIMRWKWMRWIKMSSINNIHKSIDDSQTYNNYSDYGADVYIKPDERTARVSVVDKFGNAAAVSTTVNM
jgi:gamma-glutamyltranspeptidase